MHDEGISFACLVHYIMILNKSVYLGGLMFKYFGGTNDLESGC